MLYTPDSMEIVSPPLARRDEREAGSRAGSAPVVRSWTATLANRWARPHIDLGICLGSNTFVVSLPTRSFQFPARVAVREARGKAIAYGLKAAEIEGREPEGVVIRRPISAGVVTDQRLATGLLNAALSGARHGVLGALQVAVAVPSHLSAVESTTLLATVKAAGARSVYLIEQTLAAAIGAGRDLTLSEGHMVIHSGAGVTQVSVAALASTVLSRSVRIAGDAFNEAIVDHVRREHGLLIDDRVAELIKRELGSALPPIAAGEMTIAGRDVALGKPAERSIESGEIYRVLEPLLALIAQEVRWVIAEMPSALLADVVKNGAVLSGGSAELRGLDDFLSQETRIRVQVAPSPEGAVARGLAALLKDVTLRKAVFHEGRAGVRGYDGGERKRTGLLGALMLTATLAFAVGSSPLLGKGAASSLDAYLGSALVPTAPSLLGGWGSGPSSPLAARALVDQQSSEMEKENARLRKLLKSPQARSTFDPIMADVVARDPRGWMSVLTLNAGAEQGLKTGMAVTDGTHLVGRISRVEKGRSQVRLFTDSKAVVAGRVDGKKASGVIVGSNAGTVEMRYLDPDSGIRAGDWVVTSGHDGVFPTGLKIGWVTKVSQPSGQNTYAASVQPAMNVHQIQNVLVLRKKI